MLVPVVEVYGLVLASLKGPHCAAFGPYRPQPCGSRHRSCSPLRLIGLVGQPNVRAIGSGIARTTGVRAIDTGLGTRLGSLTSATSRTQIDEAGDQITGFALSVSLSDQVSLSSRSL